MMVQAHDDKVPGKAPTHEGQACGWQLLDADSRIFREPRIFAALGQSSKVLGGFTLPVSRQQQRRFNGRVVRDEKARMAVKVTARCGAPGVGRIRLGYCLTVPNDPAAAGALWVDIFRVGFLRWQAGYCSKPCAYKFMETRKWVGSNSLSEVEAPRY